MLSTPVCLIAHNGNKFDFPLLRREFARIGTSLPSTVLCSDSLLAFQAEEKYRNRNQIVNTANGNSQIHSHVAQAHLSSNIIPPYGGNVQPNGNSEQRSSDDQGTTPLGKPYLSFRLASIFRRVFNCDMENSHTAESDCIALVRLYHKLHKYLIPYTDEHASLLCTEADLINV